MPKQKWVKSLLKTPENTPSKRGKYYADENTGIYVVYSDFLKKAYIGQSLNCRTRLRAHKYSLEKGKYGLLDKRKKEWQEDYNNHKDSFVFTQITTCDQEDLETLESQYSNEWYDNGYELYNAFVIQSTKFIQCPEPYHQIVSEVISMLDRKVMTVSQLKIGLENIRNAF